MTIIKHNTTIEERNSFLLIEIRVHLHTLSSDSDTAMTMTTTTHTRLHALVHSHRFDTRYTAMTEKQRQNCRKNTEEIIEEKKAKRKEKKIALRT